MSSPPVPPPLDTAPRRPTAPSPAPAPTPVGRFALPDRETLIGLAISMGVHGLLLLVLALWWFAPPPPNVRRFDSRLEAGSPFGDDMADQLRGSLGLDAPLTFAPPPDEPTVAPLVPLSPADPSLAPTISAAARSLTGSGGLDAGAGSGDGFGVARFGAGGELINGVEVKVGDPQLTLIWDSKADLDLHVIEPGGSEIFWETTRGKQGGELDVDDLDGFGPENVNYSGGKGRGPAGRYQWFVKYYGSMDGLSHRTRWKVRVKHDGIVSVKTGTFKRIGERSDLYTLTLDRPGDESSTADAAKSSADR